MNSIVLRRQSTMLLRSVKVCLLLIHTRQQTVSKIDEKNNTPNDTFISCSLYWVYCTTHEIQFVINTYIGHCTTHEIQFVIGQQR